MSASGEGTENLNKEGETPTATVSKGKSPAKDDIDSCSLKDVAPNPIVAPATKADSLEDPAVIEALIEKKLPTDKEKGLDVDSELDFELKWDDDTDLNENQDIADVDLDNAGKELEAHGTSIEKDKDKEADSAFTSIEQKFDTGSTSTSVEKDLDSLDRDTDSASMSIDKYVDKETEGILSSIDEHLDIAGKEVEHLVISGEKSDDIDSVTDERTDTNTVPNTYSDVNVKTMDVGEESQKGIDNETKIIPTSSKEDLLNKEVTVAEDKTFNIDTNVKIDLKTKTSPTESEATSLDEELVYSDAEGDVDDKDLLDEIDATDISNDKLEHTETPMTSDLLTSQKDEIDATDNRKNKLEDTETPMISDLLTSQKGEIDATDNSNNKLEHTERSISSDLLTSQKDEIDASDNSNNKLEHTETPIPSDLLTSQKDKIDATDNSNDKSEHSETLISSDLLTSQKDDKVTAEKDENEMEVDADVITQMTQKSDLNDTISSATDNTSSYDINKDHGLDRPDVMIDIPTQELIDTFDDADETFDNTNGNVDQSVSNIIDKLDIETTGDNTENLTEPKAIEDLIIPEETDETNVDKLLTDEIQTSNNKLAEDIAGPESMDIDNNDTEVTEKLELETTDLETNKPDEQNVNTLKEKVTHADIILEANSEHPKLQQDESLIGEGKSNEDEKESSDNLEKNVEDTVNKDVEAQPSTSKYHQESSDEDQEATDSLGLLAESSRVMDDEDEQEQEPEPEDDDDDEDFDQDDESNQMTAEHSEDSNAQHSEADIPKETMEVDESNDAQAEESNDMAEMDTPDDLPDAAETPDEHDDESSDELDIQIGQVLSQNEVEEVIVAPETLEVTDEAQKAVDDLLEDEKDKESTEVPQVLTITAEKETVEPAESDSETAAGSKLRQLLLGDGESSAAPSEEKKSPSKTKKLEIAKPKNEINIVELEESSSEDDIQVVKQAEKPASPKDVTSVTIPSEIEVMAASAGETSDIQEKDGEVRVSGLPKPQPQKPTRLNTDEISIKTASATEPLVIPETTAAPKAAESKASIDFGLEIFSLDSDDEETEVRSKRKSKLTAVELDKARQTNKCINMNCTSDGSVPLVPASISAAIYYAANQQRGGGLCLYCAKRFEERSEKLVEGVKDLTPFLSMDMCLIREEFVEISDSDSDDEPDIVKNDSEIIGEKGAKFLEEQLADMFNETWKKFNMEERLLSAQTEINIEVSQLEEECKEIDAMLNECQRETDKLRNDLYAKFADDRTELPPIAIIDTPTNQWSGLEDGITSPPPVPETRERPKRRSAAAAEPPAKRAAIPLGYAPLDGASTSKPVEAKPTPSADLTAQNDDDNADISVVKLSVEAAPAGLPPPGVAARAALRPGMPVYAMRNSFGAWHKVRIQEVQPKTPGQFTMCRVRFEQPKTMTKLLPARCLAYEQPPEVRLTIGTRVVALFKDHRVSVEKKEEGEKKEAYYSGIVAEIPNPVNNFRYLIFFDDGYAQYVQHANTRLVCECAPRVWDEVHPFSRNFVRDYLRAYPERPMVRLHAGQSIKTEWDGKWWVSKVLQVDASLVLVYFEGKKDNKTEWIYRGSTRLAPLYLELQAAERTRARPLPRAQAARRYNMPYVEYTRSDEDKTAATPTTTPQQTPAQIQAQMEQEIRRQRAVAKKSTALPPAPAAPAPPTPAARDNVTSRVVFYTPKNAIKPHKMVPHTCGPRCRRTDVLALKDLRTYNPLTKPLLSGWERQTVRYRIPATKAVMYRAPCGRRIRNYDELHRYLQAIDSDMGVDLFDFNPTTHCLAEFLLNKCLISKKDLSHGKENVPVPCVNYYDSSLPEFCSYNTERTPTAGVPLNLDPEFLCGCDCTDDCADKSKCACWKMTLEGARTIGLDTNEVGYVYKRLPEPLPSGIYECNSRCKCKQTCLNRVAQHPLQLKLQVFKTANRGWGIRALNDVPKGAFLCVYAGNLLTDATANLDGLNEGDEYLAELDYIEVVEQMKEGFEEDIPEDAKKADEEENESSSMSSSSEEEQEKQNGDDDFRPAMPAGRYTPSEYSKRLRKREKSKKEKEEREKKQKEKDGNEDCITISDDEELREPAHFSAQAGMGGKEFVSKYKSVRTLFGKDEACYIMDAKVQGNIGRYLNHSCTPNVFVQNVFVDTHDPRFPWVAFFALSQIRAGTELTWNYNYDVGSVPGKVLYCYCNAPNCRGRLL